MLSRGNRIVIPYLRSPHRDLGIAEITDFDNDLAHGESKFPEPIAARRDNVFRSDLQLIISPGVVFDTFGGRMGCGDDGYDTFLRELKGKVPIVGLAYQGIYMDQIITENGPLLKEAAPDLGGVGPGGRT
jgi:5-formyltetrahydrofolate cyclo-ligase